MIDPGSAIGMAFGSAAAGSLVLVMLYSARRSVPAVRSLGATRLYLQVHLWGGGAFFVLLLLHTDARLPTAGLTIALWVSSLWVIATGVVGLLLQRTLPMLLQATVEVNLERVPDLIAELRGRAERLMQTADARLQLFYATHVARDMAAPQMSIAALFQRDRYLRSQRGEMDILRRTLAPSGVTTLDALHELRVTKHHIDTHYSLQRVLRAWLYFHLPVAIVLLGLVVLHVFFIMYY